MVVAACKEVHALTCDAGDVDSVNAGEVHLAKCLAIHCRIGNYDALRHHRPLLVSKLPVNFNLRANKRLDGLSIGLGTDDLHLVVELEYGVASGN